MVATSRALSGIGAVLEHQPGTDDTPPLSPGVVAQLQLELIVAPPRERTVRNDESDPDLAKLAESLRLHGLLHPIGVRPLPSGRFEVVYGSRRVAAARRLGWQTIAASLHMELSDERGLLTGLAENIARRDLSGRERAHVLRLLAGIQVRGTAPGGRGAGTGKMLPPPKQPCSTNGLARQLGVNPRTIYAWVGIGRSPEVLELVETEVLDWTRAGEIVRASATVRQQLIAEVVSSGESARTRMTTLEIRARGRELAGCADFARSTRALRSALESLSSIDVLRMDEDRQLLDDIAVQIARLRKLLNG